MRSLANHTLASTLDWDTTFLGLRMRGRSLGCDVDDVTAPYPLAPVPDPEAVLPSLDVLLRSGSRSAYCESELPPNTLCSATTDRRYA